MADPSIRETVLTPKGDGGVAVELHISDAPLDDEDAAFVLRLHVEIPPQQGDRLSQVQREALKVASQVIRDLISAKPRGRRAG